MKIDPKIMTSDPKSNFNIPILHGCDAVHQHLWRSRLTFPPFVEEQVNIPLTLISLR